MHLTEFFVPGTYENPLTPSGRGRTVAAFRLAQGDVQELSQAEMRRDVLNVLMSASAVNYWLNTKNWLELTRKVGKIQILRLTDAGIVTCANSINGGGHIPTTPELVSLWVNRMKNRSSGYERKLFAPLTKP